MASSYVTVGSGDHHVLAIHGWFGSAGGWGSLPEWLDGSAYTWVFMNLRGYGDRRDVAGEFTVDEAAADALAVADDLSWTGSRWWATRWARSSATGYCWRPRTGCARWSASTRYRPARCRSTTAGWALFSGAPPNPRNRAAIIDFTTGNKLTRTFINRVVAELAGQLHGRGVRRLPSGVGQVGLHRPGQGGHGHAGQADRGRERPGDVG